MLQIQNLSNLCISQWLQDATTYTIIHHLYPSRYDLQHTFSTQDKITWHLILSKIQEQYIPSTRKIMHSNFRLQTLTLCYHMKHLIRTGNTRPPTSWQALELVAWGVAPLPHSRPLPWEMMGSPWRNGWSCSWYEVEWKLWKLPKCRFKENKCIIYNIMLYYHDI